VGHYSGIAIEVNECVLQLSLAHPCSVFEAINDSFLPLSCIKFLYHEFMKNNFADFCFTV